MHNLTTCEKYTIKLWVQQMLLVIILLVQIGVSVVLFNLLANGENRESAQIFIVLLLTDYIIGVIVPSIAIAKNYKTKYKFNNDLCKINETLQIYQATNNLLLLTIVVSTIIPYAIILALILS